MPLEDLRVLGGEKKKRIGWIGCCTKIPLGSWNLWPFDLTRPLFSSLRNYRQANQLTDTLFASEQFSSSRTHFSIKHQIIWEEISLTLIWREQKCSSKTGKASSPITIKSVMDQTENLKLQMHKCPLWPTLTVISNVMSWITRFI